MIRENRYLVINRDDLSYLTSGDQLELSALLYKIKCGRENDGKPKRNYVLVADHWPEYETVWKMIEDRVNQGEATT